MGFALSRGHGDLSRADAPSLLGSFHRRYFGYYDRAVTVFTHISDQFSVFAGRVISCSVREAIYVLDALLENETVLRPREHKTDTHGYTEQLFGLCHLHGAVDVALIAEQWDQLARLAASLRNRTW